MHMEPKEVYKELSLSTFAALFVKKIHILLICAAIGMMIGVGFEFMNSNSEKQLELYSVSLQEYQSSVESLESKIAYLTSVINSLNERNQQNPIMSMQQNDLFRADIQFMIVADSDQNAKGLTTLLKSFWDTTDLSTILKVDIRDEWLRSFITLSSFSVDNSQSAYVIGSANPGVVSVAFCLSVYYDDETIAARYVSEIFSAIDSFLYSYEVVVSNVNVITEKYVGLEILNQVEDNRSKVSEATKKYYEAINELKYLMKNKPSKYHFMKTSILGFLAGGFIAYMFVVISLLSSNPVVLSFDAENRLGIPFLGAIFGSNGFFSSLSRKVIGERCYINKETALQIVKNNLSNPKLDIKTGDRITVLCSINDKTTKTASETVCEILTDYGFSAVYVPYCLQNPEALQSIQNSEAVILIEEQWKSRWINVVSIANIIERNEKTILGFILC